MVLLELCQGWWLGGGQVVDVILILETALHKADQY